MHSSNGPAARDATRRVVFTRGMFAPFFVYASDACPDDPAPLVVASSGVEAVHAATDPREVLCVATLGAVGDGLGGPMQAVSLSGGRCLLVLKGEWPAEEAVTHAALWASLDPVVQERVRAQWASFAARHERP